MVRSSKTLRRDRLAVTASVFTVVSETEIIATVPRCATTGNITVTTPSGTLASNVPFRVTPRVLSFSPKSGPVGTRLVITGESFRKATAVSLACKWAMSFTVDSDTQITAIVPTGATSGKIGVTTTGGHAESAASFSVTP